LLDGGLYYTPVDRPALCACIGHQRNGAAFSVAAGQLDDTYARLPDEDFIAARPGRVLVNAIAQLDGRALQLRKFRKGGTNKIFGVSLLDRSWIEKVGIAMAAAWRCPDGAGYRECWTVPDAL
jgi:hypothetical protein